MMSAPGGSSGWETGAAAAAQLSAEATAGRDDVQPSARVGVAGEAAVFGDRADGEHDARARRIRHIGGPGVAGGAEHEYALAVGIAEGAHDRGDVRAHDPRPELEREVDDV